MSARICLGRGGGLNIFFRGRNSRQVRVTCLFPKDPPVLKTLRRVNSVRGLHSLRRWKNATKSAQKCWFFFEEKKRQGNGADSENLRR